MRYTVRNVITVLKQFKAARVCAAMNRFVQKGNWFVVTLVAMYSENDSVKFKDASL